MMKETEDIVHMSLDFLPLKSYANITENNALKIDWESIVPKKELNFIMGNGSVLFRLNAENTDFMRVCECLAYKLAA